MRLVWSAIALVIACGSKSEEPAGPLRMISDAEIAASKAALMKRLDANKLRRCERPVLRGTPISGSGAADIASFQQPDGNFGKCLTALAELSGKKEDLTKPGPAVVELDGRCGIELEGVIRKAAQHADGCSPFQTGVRTPRSSYLPYLLSARLMAMRARIRADGPTKDVDGALWLILDSIRMYQDLARGHTSLLVGMVAAAATDALLDEAQLILTNTTPAGVAELASAVDALIASTPPISEMFSGEGEHMSLQFGLPPLQPAGWTPPGGWPDDKRPTANAAKANAFGAPEDGKAIMLVVAEATTKAFETACPSGASFKTCHAGLVRVGREGEARARGNDDIKRVYDGLVAKAKAGDETARTQIRDTIVDILAGLGSASFPRYADKPTMVLVRLVGMRMHLEVLRAKQCPAAAALAAPPYAALRAPALLGDAVVVAVGSNAIEVKPPAWLKLEAKPGKTPWVIPCKP
ncbi:MAG: hypothetical protein ABI867_37170 [Kofleriaceae bacterium]